MTQDISIEWFYEGFEELEDYILKELENIKSYIGEAISFLVSRPKEVTHSVQIWLNLPEDLPEELFEGDFFIDIIIEPSKYLSITLYQIGLTDDIDVEKYMVGIVHVPPYDSYKLSQIEGAREQIREYLKYRRDNWPNVTEDP